MEKRFDSDDESYTIFTAQIVPKTQLISNCDGGGEIVDLYYSQSDGAVNGESCGTVSPM